VNKPVIILLFFALFISSCDNTDEIIDIIQNPPLTEAEVVAGLKSALTIGTDTAVSIVSKVNGYYLDELIKIYLPPEADIIVDNADNPLLAAIGMQDLIDDIILEFLRKHHMQLLLTDSVEFGLSQGLNVIPGHVLRFPDGMEENGEKLKVPHMGWNQLSFKISSPFLNELPDGTDVYFVHSYYARPDDDAFVATTTNYGLEFCSSIVKDNIVATQFHPEKSQAAGLRILKNFGEMS